MPDERLAKNRRARDLLNSLTACLEQELLLQMYRVSQQTRRRPELQNKRKEAIRAWRSGGAEHKQQT